MPDSEKQVMTKISLESWINIKTLPEQSMLVNWKYADGIEDIGFYRKDINEFMSYDLKSRSEIILWKPFDNRAN